MDPMPLNLVARVVGAGIPAPAHLHRVVTGAAHSTESVKPGYIFFAERGFRHDGHDFLDQAAKQGAVAAVVERHTSSLLPQLLVPSSRIALGRLAAWHRSSFAHPVIGVTGSVGKTSTKEMIAEVVNRVFGSVHSSRGNWNNEVGMPLELLKGGLDEQVSVLELAMRGANQIEYLSSILRPTVGVITNAQWSHVGILGSQAAIASAKMEIARGVDSEGTLVVPCGDDRLIAPFSVAKRRMLTFGTDAVADFQVTNLTLDARGRPSFRINGVPFHLQGVAGEFHSLNAAAAAAALSCTGISIEQVAAALADYRAPAYRGDELSTEFGARIVNATYNASPDSVLANLKTMDHLSKSGIHCIVVLGDMAELGEFSAQLHRAVAAFVETSSIGRVIIIGDEFAKVLAGSSDPRWQICRTVEDAATLVRSQAGPDSWVLAQASRQVRLEKLVHSLAAPQPNGHRKMALEWRLLEQQGHMAKSN